MPTWDNLTADTDFRYRPISYMSTVTSNWNDIPKFLTTNDLDEFAHKIYKIITEHTHIDITEDEFMDIINDN